MIQFLHEIKTHSRKKEQFESNQERKINGDFQCVNVSTQRDGKRELSNNTVHEYFHTAIPEGV